MVSWKDKHEFPKKVKLPNGTDENLGYSYDEVWIVGAKFREIDYARLNSEELVLEKEPENPYDSEAVKVLQNGQHIGYMQKGKLKDMANDYLNVRDKSVQAWLTCVSEEQGALEMTLGFYRSSLVIEAAEEENTEIECWLVKTNKKDPFDTKRRENLDCSDAGEELGFEMEEDPNTYEEICVVMNGAWEEIGELPKSVMNKFEKMDVNLDTVSGVLDNPETGDIRLII